MKIVSEAHIIILLEALAESFSMKFCARSKPKVSFPISLSPVISYSPSSGWDMLSVSNCGESYLIGMLSFSGVTSLWIGEAACTASVFLILSLPFANGDLLALIFNFYGLLTLSSIFARIGSKSGKALVLLLFDYSFCLFCLTNSVSPYFS